MESLKNYSTHGELYDLSMLESLGDAECMVEMLTVLLNEAPADIKGMKEAYESGKADIVCQKAHKLKGSTGIIQAQKLTPILEEIEAIGKKGNINTQLHSLIDTAVTEYNLIEAALKNYINELA
jgi:HPt (histidine-containing phosphotransfer) domain-containing protein